VERQPGWPQDRPRLPLFRLHPAVRRCLLHGPAFIAIYSDASHKIEVSLEHSSQIDVPYTLALWKLTLLVGLLVLYLIFLAVRLESPSLNTKMSLASGVLSVVATMGCLVEPFLEDQRSIKPSDLIVLYQSAAMVLAVPRLRTIWLISSVLTIKVVWTGIFILTTGTVLIESVGKFRLLKWVNRGAVINIGTCLDCCVSLKNAFTDFNMQQAGL
jgi:hypothetical protein